MPELVTVSPMPARVGKYQLLRRLAIGGMGEIFLAREEGVAGLTRLVVVKLLLPELAERADGATLFVDEARIAAHLAHPNIVQLYELGCDGAMYFQALEYVPGQNLARVADRAARDGVAIPRVLAVHAVAELARALAFAHEARDADGTPLEIVHRDVSPHNVMVSWQGDVKLMDFGIARATNARHRTATGVVLGKLAYMSPEQAEGARVDARSDVFSAAIVLWELTLGRRLFEADTDAALHRAVLEQPIPRPRDLDPTYPPDLEEIVLAALVRDREARTPSADALASALRAYVARSEPALDAPTALGAYVRGLFPDLATASATGPAPSAHNDTPTRAEVPPPDAAPPPAVRRRQHRAPVIAAALVAACAAFGGVWWMARGGSPPGSTAVSPVDAGVTTVAAATTSRLVFANTLGGEVTVDHRSYGRRAHLDVALPLGSHNLRVVLTGARVASVSQTFDILAGRTTTCQFVQGAALVCATAR